MLYNDVLEVEQLADLSTIALQYFALRLTTLKNLYEFQEEHNAEAVKAGDKWIEDTIQNLSEEDKEEFYNAHFDEHHEYSSVHPQLIREGIFLQAYFNFESCLNNYCNLKKTGLNLKKSYHDLDGSGIKRAMIFLRNYCEITEPFNSDEWKRIKTFNYLRNSLVHHNGYIEDLWKIPDGVVITEYEGSDKQTFTFDETFINHMFDTYIGFINRLDSNAIYSI